MKFTKGNQLAKGRGRPRGAVTWQKRRLAEAARELFENEAPDALRRIIRGRNPMAAIRALEFLADRGYGRAPEIIRFGIDPDSPEGVLLALAGQPMPGYVRLAGAALTGSGAALTEPAGDRGQSDFAADERATTGADCNR